jgi:PhzF family phenazine biosynthesis protein
MPVPIQVVDAFTGEAFRGNPAAVCLLERPAPEPWMRAVAAEMNLSETAFVSPCAEGGHDLRWFTPTVEVDLCGHATLAAAHVLAERSAGTAGTHVFRTRSGALTCECRDGEITMDFPTRPATEAPSPARLSESLDADIVWCGRGVDDLLVEVANAEAVQALRPDMAALAGLPVRGVIVTARGGPDGYDFVSRFFAPASGVPEDPVTGSAHCTLAVHWAARLGRTRFRAWQASARGGEVRVELLGERVRLGGRAVTVWRGELLA